MGYRPADADGCYLARTGRIHTLITDSGGAYPEDNPPQMHAYGSGDKCLVRNIHQDSGAYPADNPPQICMRRGLCVFVFLQ